jgi:nucleotide-binding universal stress UspA family protein
MARILVPFDGGAAAEYALDVACTTAAIDGDEVCAAYVIRVPPQLPINADLPTEHAHVEHVFERAQAIADRYHAALTTITVEARQLGPAIVEAAQGCDCVMIGQQARRRFVRRLRFGRTLRYIVAHAPCQVLVGYAPPIGEPSATPQFVLVNGAIREHATDNVLSLPEHPPAAAASERR